MDARDLRDGYDRSAARYEERFAELQRPKLDAVLARVAPRGRVLDVGCGTGLLALRVPRVVGVDISLEMLRLGRGARVQGDAYALPLRAASFDTAFAITSLLGDIPRALVELHRVLRAGGTLAVTLLREDVPPGFERELRAAGFAPGERFECGQDVGWIAERR
ncbi:MAG: class I SAM-dependent methyltransferase [Planctomycetota bacterium]